MGDRGRVPRRGRLTLSFVEGGWSFPLRVSADDAAGRRAFHPRVIGKTCLRNGQTCVSPKDYREDVSVDVRFPQGSMEKRQFRKKNCSGKYFSP